MAAAPYIPAKDADFDTWFANFSGLITAAPATYGLTSGNATTIANAYNAWHAAYLLAIDPPTRTSVTVAAKDAERTSAEAVIRPFAQQVAKDNGVTNGDKVALGLNLPNNTRPPIPAPTTQPALAFRQAQPLVHIMAYSDVGSPTGKAKPVGAIGVEVWRKIGTSPETNPDACNYYATMTKSPFRSEFTSADVGKLCTYYTRFVTKSGPGGKAAVGPWSAAVTIAIV